ncbi:GNS1/SUR4 family protein, partial [Cooperia oncophora]
CGPVHFAQGQRSESLVVSVQFLFKACSVVFRYALPFEKVDDPVGWTLEFQRYWYHSITISVVYFATMKALQRIMENRKPFSLKTTLFLWNAALAVFSIIGFIRFTEDFAQSLYKHGIYRSLCYSCHPNDVAAFWSFCFAISKVVELGDTLFIVLRKKPLIFLHYYHHAAVLIYTVHSGNTNYSNTNVTDH